VNKSVYLCQKNNYGKFKLQNYTTPKDYIRIGLVRRLLHYEAWKLSY